jgi:hypothetical protein
MSKITKTQITCPKCKNVKECSVYDSMNVTVDPKLKDEFMANKWNIFSCDNCDVAVPISSHVMYHDMTNKIAVWCIPDGDLSGHVKATEMYDRLLGPDNYLSNAIIVNSREDFLLMVHLCDKNGVPESQEGKEKFKQIIQEMRDLYRNKNN